MKIFLYLFLTSILITNCNSNKSKTSKDSTKPSKVVENNKNIIESSVRSIDSIDKENNESVILSGDEITKAYVFLTDSSIHLTANIRRDHRIFGYEKPNINSKKLLLLSVFTNDVENNPFKYELGAYYETSDMEDLDLRYLSTLRDFIKAVAIDKSNKQTVLYFERKWIEFENN